MSKSKPRSSSSGLPQSKRRKVQSTLKAEKSIDADSVARMRLQKLGESFMRQFENSDDSADSDVGEDQAFIAKSGPQVGCARRSSDEIRGEHKDSDSESLSERESESENESESESESNSESDESRAVGDDESNSHTSGIKRRKSHAKGEEDTSPTCRRKVMGRATGFANNSQNTRTRVVSQKIQKRQPLVVDATGYGNMNNKFQETAMRKERQNFLSAKVSDVHTKVGREQKSMELGDKFSGNYLDWMEDVHKEVEKLGASALMGRAKKQYEAKEIIRLGGNAPKNQKVPLIIKTGMNKKAKERAVKAETALKLLGMYVKKPKEKVERNDDDKGLDIHAGVGSFKAGVLKVNKDLFAQPSAVKRGPKPSGKGGARNGAKGRKRK